MLTNCYVWCDYYSIPQSARVPKTASKAEKNLVAQYMYQAVQSLPAYVSRAKLMIILAPLVQHENLVPQQECDFCSWCKRGWCRLEETVAQAYPIDIIRVDAVDKISIIKSANDVANHHVRPVGTGDFTCCQVNHEMNGWEVPCDLPKVALVLQGVFRRRLNNHWTNKDQWQYRWSLVNQHLVFRGLEQYTNDMISVSQIQEWPAFAAALELRGGPLEKTTGDIQWSPLLFAVIANNHHITKFLLENGANPNEVVEVPVGHAGYEVRAYTPLHFVMRGCFGEPGKKILSLLMKHGANPFICQYHKGQYFDPFGCGIVRRNNEMLMFYMQCVFDQHGHPTNFHKKHSHFGDSNAVAAVIFQVSTEVIGEMIRRGAIFSTKNDYGCGVVQSYAIMSKIFQQSVDTDGLQLLIDQCIITKKHINAPLLNPSKIGMKMFYNLVFFLSYWDHKAVRDDGKAQFIYKMAGGTALHAAIERDKPRLVQWLLANGADYTKATRLGKTALMSCLESKRKACIGVLAEHMAK